MGDIGYMNAKALRDAARDMLDARGGPLMEPLGNYCDDGACTECAYQKGVEGAAKWREKKSACRCRNHMGSPKLQHKSRRAALNEAMRRARKHRGYSFGLYPCPAQPGVWHLTTKERK